ncbi:MAG: NAD-dependent epimerase/dehydratase family protein, partial [bacterium]
MTAAIFLTGARGLIGQATRRRLQARGFDVVGCDLRADCEAERYDFRDAARMRERLAECDGVIHLGALSRVLWGERYPTLCRSINVDGAASILSATAQSPRKPWLIFASSREIYGTPPRLPCAPDTPPNP